MSFEVSLEVTHQCLCRCIFCSSEGADPSPIKNEITFSETLDLLRSAREDIGANVFSISGGEPFINKNFDMYSVVYNAWEMGYKTLIYTSGVTGTSDNLQPIPEEVIRVMKGMGATLIFDFQSCDPKTNNKLMGNGEINIHDVLLESLQIALKVGIPVETHIVPQKSNLKDIYDTFFYLQDLGVEKVSVLRCVPQGRAYENDVNLDYRQFWDLQRLLLRLLEDPKRKTKLRLGHPVNWLGFVDPKKPITACRGGKDAPLIKPDGNVDMCPAWKGLSQYTAGNIREQSIADIWNNSEFYKIFRWFIDEGYKEVKNGICEDCMYLSQCKCGCTAQRIYSAIRHYYFDPKMPLKQMLLTAPPDPMCPMMNR